MATAASRGRAKRRDDWGSSWISSCDHAKRAGHDIDAVGNGGRLGVDRGRVSHPSGGCGLANHSCALSELPSSRTNSESMVRNTLLKNLFHNFVEAGLDDGNWATLVALFAPDGTARLTRCGITPFKLANHLVDSHHMTHLISATARRPEWKRSRVPRCGWPCGLSAAAVDEMQASVRAATWILGLCRHLPDVGDGGRIAADACRTFIYPFALSLGLPALPAAAVARPRVAVITYAKAVS